MQELRLVAVSEDGSYLVLATAGRGTRFTLPVDDRLRAAVRGHFSRLGQYEIEVESPLRPKEIQARIRAGETAEEIAETAGIPIERVRWFEGPVLQEREYMAQQAQRVTIRRQGESAPAPALGEIVEERLGKRGIDLEEVEWDSRKCEDSTWRVRLSFSYDGRPYAAEWAYDPRRRNISAVNEEASRLSSLDLDDAVDDTVTPFLPRRAMKVVGDPTRDDHGPRHAPRNASEASVQEFPKAEPSRTESPLRAEPPRPDPKIAERAAAERETAEREAAEREAAAEAARETAERAAAQREALELAERQQAAAEAARETAARETAEREAAERAAAQREALELAERQQAAAEAARETAARETAEREAAERAAAQREALELAERQQAAAEAARETALRETAEREKAEREKAEREAADREASAAAERAKTPPKPREPAAAASHAAKPASVHPPATPTAKPEPKPAEPAAKPAETEQPAAAATLKPAPPPAQEKRPAARKKARGKRASVPSWDEIMFGARRPE